MAKDNILRIAVESLPESSVSIVQLFSAFLTPTIAVLGIFIAIQQWRLNRQRFRHETYERRLKIYKLTHLYLSNVARSGGLEFEEGIKFKYETSEALFLFDKSVVNHLDEIFEQTMDLSDLKQELESESSSELSDEDYKKKTKDRNDLQRWVVNQIIVSRDLFTNKLKINVT